MHSLGITEDQKQQYQQEGFMVIEKALDNRMLDFTRRHCDAAVQMIEERLRGEGKTEDGINLLGKRYFISHYTERRPELFETVFNDVTAEICRATIGPDAWLHTEQFVVKYPDEGGRFAWHQDGGYTIYRGEGAEHRPYVTCWIALDDVSDANGTLRILPAPRAGTRELKEHVWVEKEGNMVGYHGDDPGDPIEMPAGSIAVFASTTFHRSGPNRTDRPRRGYFVAFSPEIIMNRNPEKGPWGRGIAFMQGERRVDPFQNTDMIL